MQRILERLSAQQQTFAGSPFLRFLRDTRLPSRARLGFLPCIAPLVLGLPQVERTLQGDDTSRPAEASGHGLSWNLYLKDLQALELSSATDLTGMVQLLWGSDGNLTRRALYGLIELSTGASPMQGQVLRMALRTVGHGLLEALEPASRAFETDTGKRLSSPGLLRAQLEQSAWNASAVELDLPPEQEQAALSTLDEVFSLLAGLGDSLLAYAQNQHEVRRAMFSGEATAHLTFQEFGTAQLQSLCTAVGYSAEHTQTVKRFFTFMCGTWGTRRIGTTPPWKSDITDDHTPFELSLAIEAGQPEVRFLMESQRRQGPTTLRSTWEDGLALNTRLSQEFGVDLTRFERVKDLFEPVNPGARFALWHAFFLKNGRPDIKLYLNPSARGSEHAHEVVRQALERLGFAGAWRCLSERVLRGGQSRIIYFSLDLSAHRAARVKLYLAHPDATADELEAVMSLAKEYVPGEAWVFCQALKGHTGSFGKARSALTCLAFTSDDDERPYSVTLHVPVRCFARSDEQAMERIRFLQEPAAHAVLRKAVRALAHRPLSAGTGLVQWASMRRQDGQVRTTFYLATEAYGAAAFQHQAETSPHLRKSRSAETPLSA